MKLLSLFITIFLLVSCAEVAVIPSVKVEGDSIPVISKTETTSESRFEIVRELPYFKEMVRVADCVINLKEFQNEISGIKSFGNTKDNGEQVKNKMLLPNKAKIRSYYYWRKTVIAYSVRDEVYFNTKNKNRSIKENVKTAIHERFHVLGYKHVSKYNIGRDVDNAYVIGKLSEKYVGVCQ